MINVTKTYLPSKEKYQQYVDVIYKNGWVTNNGPLLKLLEKRLAKYLGVKNIVLVYIRIKSIIYKFKSMRRKK